MKDHEWPKVINRLSKREDVHEFLKKEAKALWEFMKTEPSVDELEAWMNRRESMEQQAGETK